MFRHCVQHNNNRRFSSKFLTLVAAPCALPLALFSSGLSAAELEEVVVTAQKREASLQDTPISVTAFTIDSIEDRGFESIADVADFTPNLVFDTTSPVSGLSSGAVVFIRGIGNTDFSLTTDPGVGTYVDGVYMSRSAGGVLDVLDLERIEILRGPQGTLFGRNTIGGAINITSRQPGEELSGKLELTLGNDERINARGSIDIPVSESLRTTFSVSSKQRDGFVDRVLVGDETGDEDRQSFRGSVVFAPNDSWDFQLSYDRTDIDEASAGSTIEGFTPGAGTVGYALATFGDIGQGLADLQQYVTDGSDDKSYGTGISGTELDIEGFSLIGTYHGNNFDIKYTGAYRETEGEFYRDPDNSPHAITETANTDYYHEQTSHELQITGSAFEDRLQYVGGLFYLEEEGTDNVFVSVFLPTPDLVAGFPARINNFADVDNTSQAAYFQGTWSFNETWSFTAGVRYSEDEKKFDYTQYISDPVGGGYPFFPGAVDENGNFTPGLSPIVGDGSGSVDETFDETDVKLGVDARLNDNTLLYYSFAQGYKSGGFVLRYVEPVSEPLSFDPETVDTHEIGVKWQSEDNRVRTNAAVFYSDYQDVQVTFFDNLGGPITANAGTVDIYGIEIELVALLTDQLVLDAGYGYTDAEYQEINDIPGLSLTIDESAKLVNTPEHSFNAGLEYTLPLGDNVLSFRVDYSYTDEMFNDSQNSPFLFEDSYQIWNALVRFSLGESLDLIAFGKNLADERYIESGDSNFGLGFHETNYNRPREYGVTARYRF
jgi:iron complex outermembrane receptor protein